MLPSIPIGQKPMRTWLLQGVSCRPPIHAVSGERKFMLASVDLHLSTGLDWACFLSFRAVLVLLSYGFQPLSTF